MTALSKTAVGNDNPDDRQVTDLEQQLNYQKRFQDITYKIHASKNVKQILVDLRDEMLSLFDANSMTIYVIDDTTNEIYSMMLTGSTLGEIRLPIDNHSIAGCVAAKKKVLNIADAYDDAELRSIDKDLSFDRRWDLKSGVTTRQVLAVPVIYNGTIRGVVQLINTKSGKAFCTRDQSLVEEMAKVLGLAFYNQERIKQKKKSKFDYLIRRGLIGVEDLEKSWAEARDKRVTIEQYLMKTFKIPKSEIGNSLSEFYNCRFVEFSEKTATPYDLLKNLKEEYLRRELWVPLERTEGTIRIIIDDPNNIIKRDMIERLLKTRNVTYDIALYEDIVKFINHFYQTGDTEGTISDLIGRLDGDEDESELSVDEDITESDSIIMQLVNRIINDAYARNASDIHIEPSIIKKTLEVRFRVDGILMVYQRVPFGYRNAVVSRIKIMSNLDITERRLPQDGKIKFRRPRGDEIELRVATIPSQGGMEDVVMRILAKGETMPLEDMGLSERNYREMVENILVKPYGMCLVVGPTGSGKTTTLHAALHFINKPETKIWTAEDPVEITQYGLRQVQINPKIGFDFASAMRSFLRADPDVIMVGEMRDHETAKTGIEASLTGHLVFSTLHTNSAPETVVRLLDMGIDPLNFADSLLGILAQRLVRTLCKACREPYHPTREECDELAENYGEELFAMLNVPHGDDLTLNRAKGCTVCDGTGYRGRMGIHELLVATPEIKDIIQKQGTAENIRTKAVEQGMRTLLQDGIEKVLRGVTDFIQVRRVCIK
ncbi:MAG: Flp pilus assembly complex ATPase component TadA [Syntrophales bacterium]|nr:Flp pilus assembly complex ATPase component TadA [Syntrophales bacterium]MCK9527349.1 Flp pilus assembly complex ATPase component TadA [Syntrophales bacterium]MDX9921181.1 ATPase, T2SS/T4P/T4SS family [Syntrophales bacterium]